MIVDHNPAEGRWGDCFRCCIASLLDMKAEDVPHFMEEGDASADYWYERLSKFLQPLGLAYLEFTVPSLDGWRVDWLVANGFSAYHVLSGTSPRGPHSVVALNGKMVHDPSPLKAGLVGPDTRDGDPVYTVGLLIRRCGA